MSQSTLHYQYIFLLGCGKMLIRVLWKLTFAFIKPGTIFLSISLITVYLADENLQHGKIH